MTDKRRAYEKPTLTRIRVEPGQQVLQNCKSDTPWPLGCWDNPYLPSSVQGS